MILQLSLDCTIQPASKDTLITTARVSFFWSMFHVFLWQAQEDYKDGNDSDSSVDSGSSSGPNFNYILNMPLWCLTKEKVEELLKQRDLKVLLISVLCLFISTCQGFLVTDLVDDVV